MTEQNGQQPETKRWRGFTHKELYLMLHDGPGAQASAEPSRRWAQLSATLSEIGQDLAATLDGSSAVWAGRAAGAARERLAPLAGWARAAAVEAGEMRVAVENQAEYVARARADMPAPEDVPAVRPDPAVPPATQVALVGGDVEPVEAAQAAGAQKAFEVMAAYEVATGQNLGLLTGFEEPAGLVGQGDIRRDQGDGVQSSGTHTSFTGHLPTQVPTQPSGVDQQPRHFHGGAGGPSGGIGVGPSGDGIVPRGGQRIDVSGASVVEAPEAFRRPIQPGLLSGASPVITAEGPVIGLGGVGGVGSGSDRSSGRSTRPLTGGSVIGADPSTSSGAGAASSGLTANPAAAAGAPMGAAGAGAPLAGGDRVADKMAMRRFGAEALGSSQWFGDTVESSSNNATSSSSARQLGGRRRDLSRGEDSPVTESVSVDGEDVALPPGVIGG
ncbi:PPE domain-containing protein [Actinokineospora auranticolor]|uniref:PPE family protein n=1 Tax=Actinokineospora auranticolor TaxID=155976 RepID=A0A2S6GX80_9PSEU|nr:PPE domain-containing protein [Actinokineospora auranticolor]PPK69761.1 PPE family protein [Actinokineospora auranticolor]